MNGKLTLHPKVVGGGLAGSTTVLLVYILSLVHVDIPTTAAAAATVVIGQFGAWLSPLIEREK